MGKILLLIAISMMTCAANSSAQVSVIKAEFNRLGFRAYEDCEMRLLPSGDEKFKVMLDDIERAQTYIHAEYYKWWNDSIGRALLDAMAERARQGVAVRVMYDAFGNSGKAPRVTKEFVQHYQKLGIDMVGFDPMRFPYINHALHRMHRKMVIIDGTRVYTGGMNVADYYIHGRPEIGPWRDMHAMLTGPIAQGYNDLFVQLWEKETRRSLPAIEKVTLPSDTIGTAYIVDRKPGKDSRNIRQAYIACLDNAQSRVRILNPYIILVSSVRKALRRAIERGVEVELMCSLKGDGVASQNSTAREVYNLQRRGAKVWLCKDGFHHDKLIIVDDTLCSVGTANLDARSLSFDYEVNAFYFSPRYSQQLNSYYDQEIKKSVQLTSENWTTLYTRKERRIGWWLKGIRGIL